MHLTVEISLASRLGEVIPYNAAVSNAVHQILLRRPCLCMVMLFVYFPIVLCQVGSQVSHGFGDVGCCFSLLGFGNNTYNQHKNHSLEQRLSV